MAAQKTLRGKSSNKNNTNKIQPLHRKHNHEHEPNTNRHN